MSNRVTKDFTVELDFGSFAVEVTANGSYDGQYGSDADGNRGTGAWDIVDLEYDLPETDEQGRKLTNEEVIDLAQELEKKAFEADWDFSLESNEEYEPEMEDL